MDLDEPNFESIVCKTVRHVCSNLSIRYDDEYLSLGFCIAWDAYRSFDKTKSDRGVYDYIKLCIYKTLRGEILRQKTREKKCKYVERDELLSHEFGQDDILSQLADAEHQTECFRDLYRFNMIKTQKVSGSRRHAETLAELKRLRAKYGKQ